jgi:hypothetical protein
MKTHNSLIVTAFLFSICLSAGDVRAQDSEQRVRMKVLPEAVQKTVREQSKGGKAARPFERGREWKYSLRSRIEDQWT